MKILALIPGAIMVGVIALIAVLPPTIRRKLACVSIRG